MNTTKRIRYYFVILAILLLFQGCKSNGGETASDVSGQSGTSLNNSDALSVIEWVTSLVTNKEPNNISAVIGANGVRFAGYGMGFESLGYNNSNEIVEALDNALKNSQPQCLGYTTYTDRANIYFRDVNFDRNEFNIITLVSFLIIKNNQNWELVAISPVPQELSPSSGELTPCP